MCGWVVGDERLGGPSLVTSTVDCRKAGKQRVSRCDIAGPFLLLPHTLCGCAHGRDNLLQMCCSCQPCEVAMCANRFTNQEKRNVPHGQLPKDIGVYVT